MTDELLRNPTHNGHLFVGALKRHKNRPVLFLGDTTLTGGQLAERISQYTQAFEALGAGTGVEKSLAPAGPCAVQRPNRASSLGTISSSGRSLTTNSLAFSGRNQARWN